MRKHVYFLFLAIQCVMCGFAKAQAPHISPVSDAGTSCWQAPEAKENASVRWGYCDDDIANAIGVGAETELKAAIYITPEVAELYRNDRVTKIQVGVSADVSNLSVFIMEDLNGEELSATQVGTVESGWHEVALDTPYELAGKGFYVGYSCYGKNQIGMSNVFAEGGHFLAIRQGASGWGWFDYAGSSSHRWNSLNLRAVIEGDNMPNDMRVGVLKDFDVKRGEPFRLNGTVESLTTVHVSGYEITCQVEGQEPTHMTIETDLEANGVDSFSIDMPAIDEISAGMPIQVALTKVNGKDDVFDGNNVRQITVRSKDELYSRVMVAEEGTGTWCGWCPRGAVGLGMMKEKYPDTFIGIAIHYNDPMSTDSYAKFIRQYFKSYPTCAVNRDKVVDPNFTQLEYEYKEATRLSADAEISMECSFVDADKTLISATAKTTFSYSEEEADYRIAFVVLENGVTGYTQLNYFYDGASGEMGGFEGLPKYVEDMTFDDVAREIYPDHRGVRESVPEKIVGGEEYTFTYEMAVPDSVKDVSNIEVVALLLDSGSERVVNACKVERILGSGIEDESLSSRGGIRFFAEDGVIKSDRRVALLKVYTLDGKQVPNLRLGAGIYVAKAVFDGGVYTDKVLVR